jgi:UDP-N-acetylmuramoylalanine--D-glutamate ligase
MLKKKAYMLEEKYLVVGAGKSGVAACNLLQKKGLKAILYDMKEDMDFTDIQKNNNWTGIEYACGHYTDELFEGITCVVMSPGVPVEGEFTDEVRRRGIKLSGEIELAYALGKGEVYAITGTNGKTTTTSLTGQIFSNYYKSVFVVGNIGIPYTSVSYDTRDDSKIIAEISSFQLETIDTFRPRVSAILNITPDHLNRHHTMDNYCRIKESITKNQTEDDTCVLNYEDDELRRFGETLKCHVIYFSSKRELPHGIYYRDKVIYSTISGKEEKIINVSDMNILGLHNYENASAAIAISIAAGIPVDIIKKTLMEFQAVEHRIEFTAEKKGVRYYNDSKGTNTDASIKAVLAMDRPILLIGGGFDKKISFDEWVETFTGRVKKLVLIGETKYDIAKVCDKYGFKDYVFSDTLEKAIDICAENAVSGDCVLLSPASASWDMFNSYEERGKIFKDYVRKLPE